MLSLHNTKNSFIIRTGYIRLQVSAVPGHHQPNKEYC